jgi:hypothetical protein
MICCEAEFLVVKYSMRPDLKNAWFSAKGSVVFYLYVLSGEVHKWAVQEGSKGIFGNRTIQIRAANVLPNTETAE